MYDKVVEGMKEAGYRRSEVQCRDKIQKLRGKYRKIKDNNNETGRNRKNLKFYGPLNEMLENIPATQPAVVIDNLHETNDVGDSCERHSEGGSAEKGTSEEDSNMGGKCEGSVAEDKVRSNKEQKNVMPRRNRESRHRMARSEKQPTNENGDLEKIHLRELYKRLSRMYCKHGKRVICCF